jgi:hypothetical protein
MRKLSLVRFCCPAHPSNRQFNSCPSKNDCGYLLNCFPLSPRAAPACECRSSTRRPSLSSSRRRSTHRWATSRSNTRPFGYGEEMSKNRWSFATIIIFEVACMPFFGLTNISLNSESTHPTPWFPMHTHLVSYFSVSLSLAYFLLLSFSGAHCRADSSRSRARSCTAPRVGKTGRRANHRVDRADRRQTPRTGRATRQHTRVR